MESGKPASYKGDDEDEYMLDLDSEVEFVRVDVTPVKQALCAYIVFTTTEQLSGNLSGRLRQMKAYPLFQSRKGKKREYGGSFV